MKNPTKKELKKSLEFQIRMEFLSVYTEFDKWLSLYNFKSMHSNTTSDYLYSHYSQSIKTLYGVEHYKNDFLRISIRFLRDKDKHVFMFVGDIGSYSEVYEIEEFKNILKKQIEESLTEIKNNLLYYETIKKSI